MYNYIIYGIVFVMWVVWFEFLSDYQPGKKTRGGVGGPVLEEK